MSELSEAQQTNIATGAFRKGLFKFGNFTLRSGAWSPFYIDLRPIPSIAVPQDENAMSKFDQIQYRDDVIDGYSTLLDSLRYDHLQAIPEAVVALTAMIGYKRGDSVLYRRVNSKTHGAGKEGILGDYLSGDRVALVDDLITTSGAKVEEKLLVEDISRERDLDGNLIGGGLVVKDAVILLDREQNNAIQTASEAGLRIHSALTLTQLVEINLAEGLLDARSYEIIQGFREGTIKGPEDI